MINLWIAVREDVELDDLKLGRILTHPDMAHIEAVMKRDTLAGKVWMLYSVYIEPTAASKTKVKTWLASHAGQVVVGGAWNMDGSQVLKAGGDPMFPIDSRLIKFMPDDIVYGQDDLEVSRTAATELKQVNVLVGIQSPRNFT
jgi:hypothetical protein